MIREIFKSKVQDNVDLVVDIIDAYFSNKYTEELKERTSDVSVSLVRSKGVMDVGEDEIYIGEDPVCVKADVTHLIFPVSFLEEKCGNVIFVHLVLHAVFNDSLKQYCNSLNEVIVDYIANDIAKILERKNINVTLEKHPVYESNSLYSNCFDDVREFCEYNKRELVEALINGDASLIKGIAELSFVVENKIDSLIMEDIDKKKFKR